MNETQTSAFWLLVEALRRKLCFHEREDIMRAWTGLGSYNGYEAVVGYGYMEPVHEQSNDDYDQWWRLTAAGAPIVQSWIDAGFYFEDYSKIRFKYDAELNANDVYQRMMEIFQKHHSSRNT